MSDHFALQRHPAFRPGLVQDQDPATGRVRVQFPDRDNVISWWLPVVTPKSQNDKIYWLPDVGEQVVVLMDEHDEYGAVMGSIFSEPDAPPAGMTADKFHVTFKDGTAVEYDRAAHALSVVGGSGATIKLTDGAGTYVYLSNDGNVRVHGNLLVDGSVTAGYGSGDQVGLQTHTHPQGPDSHGDSEQETGAPGAGT